MCLLLKPLLKCLQARMAQQLQARRWLQVLLRAVDELGPH